MSCQWKNGGERTITRGNDDQLNQWIHPGRRATMYGMQCRKLLTGRKRERKEAMVARTVPCPVQEWQSGCLRIGIFLGQCCWHDRIEYHHVNRPSVLCRTQLTISMRGLECCLGGYFIQGPHVPYQGRRSKEHGSAFS